MSDDIKRRIKKLYGDLGLTQKLLASTMGIGRNVVKKIINQSDEDFKIGDLKQVCDALGVSLFDFFNSDEFYSTNMSDKPFKKKLDGFFHDRKVNQKYEVFGYDHAGDILKCYPNEFKEIRNVLRNLDIDMKDIISSGGNESAIPKKIRDEFLKQGWKTEQEINGTLQVELKRKSSLKQKEIHTIKGYLTGYMIDYYKNGIAVDTEWNSKDQTFDRDLAAMRSYYESGLISMGVIITRGSELCSFPAKYRLHKYGASTTWLNQLIERLDCRRAGGCPILAIGITPKAIKGFSTD